METETDLTRVAVAPVSRRGWLQGAGAVLGAALASPAVAQGVVGRKAVLVLGAGMAGLTAALSLLRRGHDVTIIEYQNRIGGRLLSVPLGDGMFTEAGGGHFRSNMPYVLAYVRRFSLPLLSLNDGLPRYMIEGRTGEAANPASWPWPLSREERNVSVSTMLNQYLYRAGLDSDTVLDSRWPDEGSLDRLGNVTLGDLIRGVGASEVFCKLLDAHGGTFTSGSLALGAIPDLAYHFGDQNLFRIQGGNSRLPLALAAAIGRDRFVLDAPVARIDQSGPAVRVTTRDGREFTGDAVISTIPFSVMEDVEVLPHWSPRKRRMIAEMEWDRTVKIIAKTRTPSWLTRNVHGWPMAGGDRPWERVIDITGNEPGGHGSVFFYLNGSNADAVLALPKEQRAPSIVAQFRQDMPDLFDEVLSTDSFAWSEQPWIKGSFGGPALGGAWMVQEWQKPEGRIHFAGDFTTLKTGWVEGAIESGLRAARQIDPQARPEGNPRIRQEI
ncbi:flavin monoamine oxidase family protein [Sabulicella rubraurantiaca]|uniref:flavin monoamine oxidase family protein n=1 Tax=Sabulicella rubraurantiaca TaxID=2811429 RepID=UPI001A970982|nr:NAD(P)/FAD-dependent oxidoreductase [Sabulicella rubraurantiaca]